MLVADCKKPDDPILQQQLIHDALKGIWVFKSVTVTQVATNKKATIDNCNGSQLSPYYNTYVFNTFKPELIYTFKSGNEVQMFLPCTNEKFDLTWTLTQNTLTFSDNRVWIIYLSNILPNQAVMTDISSFSSDFKLVYVFNK